MEGTLVWSRGLVILRPTTFCPDCRASSLRDCWQGRRRYPLRRDKTLFEIGAIGDGCYWLEEGVLKVSIASPQGAERILAILGPGSIVGELAMLDGLPRSATVQALRDSRLTFVARSIFLECLRDYPGLYSHLVTILVERMRQADDEVGAASFLSLKARVARALLQFAKHLGEPTGTPDELLIRHRIRQVDLAALAHVARENVSRIMSEWTKRKIIDRRSSLGLVIHKARLEREARFSE
jgi:CRP/FNR family transcriptional regulator, cyclic AMP receptor protein